MARRDVPVHYLRPNHTEWSPPALITLDTETRTLPGREPQVLGFRCWYAQFHDRRTRDGVAPRRVGDGSHVLPELVEWIDTVTRNRECVWLYTHNLAFDLAVTRLPLRMLAAGWAIHDAAVGGKSPWMTLGKGKRVITLVDSVSWLQRPLADVARMVGITKPPLPGEGDEPAAWLARCRADVQILETAMLQLMDWWDANTLGRWAISGPASGWNAYRHVPTPERPVIDPDPDTVKAERDWVHAGRRGTWRVGEHRAGPFLELDLAAAYPTVAATLPLPLQRVYRFDALRTDDDVLGSDRWGVCAWALVDTDVPRWPVRIGGRTWYPVGRFWCQLSGPDLAAARELGALVAVGPGWVHRLGHNMAAWARWCLAVQNGQTPDAPEVALPVAKGWGRSVIGRWSARSFERTKLGTAPTDAWDYEEGWDHTADAPGGILDLAGQRFWVSQSGSSDNAYPAVLAWVESYVRVRLNRVIEALGAGCVMQCDTDGVIVAARTIGTVAAHGALVAPDGLNWQGRLSWCLERLAPLCAPLELRRKDSHSSVFILGPQHVQTPTARRFAGLPGMAEPTPDGRYRARLWPGLSWQMRHGDPDGYVRPEVTVTVKGPFPTGWILADNTVVPVEAELDRRGQPRLVAWSRSRYAAANLSPAAIQHAALDELW